MSVAAANAGKDIWCEKPMSRTIYEGEKVVEAVQRNGRIFRLNTWFRFKDGFYGMNTTVKPLKKLVMSGMLGWPLTFTLNSATGFGWKLDTWSGKVSARYEFNPGYAIRGSLSNGFRAPSLQQTSYSSILPNYVNNPANPT